MTTRSDTPTGLLPVVVPPLTVLVVWPLSRDGFMAPKLALLTVAAAALVALGLRQVGRDGRIALPSSPWALALGAHLLLATLATLTSPAVGASFFGLPGRQAGLLLVLAAGALALGATVAATERLAGHLVDGLLGAGAILGVVAGLQAGGVDLLPFDSDVSGAYATMANPNFAGTIGGAIAGAGLWRTIIAPRTTRDRTLGAAGLIGGLVTVVAAGSVIGFLSAATSLGVVVLGWLLAGEGARRRIGVPAVVGGGVVGAVLVGLGTAEAGPLAAIGATRGVVLRRHYWEAALEVIGDNPVLGVGLDRFVAVYRAARSQAAADAVDLVVDTDAAHSVPLHLATGGGLLLLLAWLAVVATTVWAIVRLLRQQPSSRTGVPAALAAVWAALTVGSLGSFDVPGLLSPTLVAAGLLAGLAWPDRTRTLSLPGTTTRTGRGRKGGKGSQAVTPSWATPVTSALAVMVLLAGLYLGTLPLRAEMQAQQARNLVAAGQPDQALQAWADAAGTAGWSADPPYRQGLLLLDVGRPADAVAAFEEAIAREDRHLGSLVSLAQAQAAAGDPDAARATYEAALVVEPRHVELKVLLADLLVLHAPEDAGPVVDEIRALDPDHPRLDLLQAVVDELG